VRPRPPQQQQQQQQQAQPMDWQSAPVWHANGQSPSSELRGSGQPQPQPAGPAGLGSAAALNWGRHARRRLAEAQQQQQQQQRAQWQEEQGANAEATGDAGWAGRSPHAQGQRQDGMPYLRVGADKAASAAAPPAPACDRPGPAAGQDCGPQQQAGQGHVLRWLFNPSSRWRQVGDGRRSSSGSGGSSGGGSSNVGGDGGGRGGGRNSHG
jgi:hypothetical protein